MHERIFLAEGMPTFFLSIIRLLRAHERHVHRKDDPIIHLELRYSFQGPISYMYNMTSNVEFFSSSSIACRLSEHFISMRNHLFLILISNHLLSTTTGLIIHTQRKKENEETCLKNHFRSFSTNNLRLCYMNNNRDRAIHIWFTSDNSLHSIFHFYRFILRSIDDVSLSTMNIYMLTNFTELIDLNNSLRIFNLHSGQYEICIDFQMNSTAYIYSPRYACIPIRIGKLLHGSFKQSSTQLLIALATGIILFLILCHVVQSMKKKQQDDDVPQVRSRSSSLLSTTSLKKQRDRIVRKFFRRQIDQSSRSQMQQWARNRAFRHRISTSEQEIHEEPSMSQWNKQSLSSSNEIYTIPMNSNSSRRTSFEEFEIL